MSAKNRRSDVEPVDTPFCGQKKGYQVTGIDIAERYLKQAEQHAAKAGHTIELLRLRGSQLRLEQRYDAILAYNHKLGFLTEQELSEKEIPHSSVREPVQNKPCVQAGVISSLAAIIEHQM